MVLCKWFSFKNNNNFLSKLILRFVHSFYLLCSLCCCQVVFFFPCIFKYLHFFFECLNEFSLLELLIFLWEVPISGGKIIGSLEVIKILPFTSPGAKFHTQYQQLVVPVPWTAIKMSANQSLIRVAIKCWRIYKILSSFFIYMTVSNPFPSLNTTSSPFIFLYGFLFLFSCVHFFKKKNVLDWHSSLAKVPSLMLWVMLFTIAPSVSFVFLTPFYLLVILISVPNILLFFLS